MKCKMKKAGYVLLCMMILSTVSSAKGDNLYVYLKDGSMQTFAVDDVQKLTFTESALVVNQAAGTSVDFPYSSLKFFSLKLFDDTGLDSESIPPVCVYPVLTSDKVTVVSATVISKMELYDLQGRRLLQLTPETVQAELSLVSYPTGLYLLHITNETGVSMNKIIKK